MKSYHSTSDRYNLYFQSTLNTVKPQYNDRFDPKEIAIKMNLLLYKIFNEQIDLKESSCFVLISSYNYVLDIS